MAAEAGWDRVAEFIQQEMRVAGWSVRELELRSGVSRPTWVKLIEGRGLSAQRRDRLTLIEKGLGWAPFSIELILKGGSPVRQDGTATELVISELEGRLDRLAAPDPELVGRLDRIEDGLARLETLVRDLQHRDPPAPPKARSGQPERRKRPPAR